MGPPIRIVNRETWLAQAIVQLRSLFHLHGLELADNIAVSCGWPGCASISKCLGETWPAQLSKGDKFEIFISPLLSEALGPQGVLSVLVHELGHVSVGLEAKHKKPFKDFMKKIGLEGKAKATIAGTQLLLELEDVGRKLGHYPHSTLNLKDKQATKQTTRLLKVQCPECDYVVRVTRKHLDEKGAPICPLHKVPFIQEESESTDNE